MTNASKPTTDDIQRAPSSVPPSEGDTHPTREDLVQRLSRVGEERDELAAELERTKQRVRTIEILDSLIGPYAERTFIFMCVYCGVVAVLLALDGGGVFGFELPSGVLQLLVGSTATTVIGLVGMVLTGIFVGARRNHY